MPRATITDVTELPMILTVKDVQDFLGVSKVTAYETVNRLGFPKIKLGRAIRISKPAFLDWLEAQGQGAQEESQ
jgi:excisionase family DNA binding protein